MKLLVLVVISFISFVACACPGTPECSGNGVCVTNVCQCVSGFSGNDCSIALRSLTPGQWLDGQAAAWQWQYYSIINPTRDINILVETKPKNGTEGLLSDCDIYVKKDNLPTSSDYTKANLDWGTTSSLLIERAQVGTWYVGVFSNFLNCSFSLRATLSFCTSPCLHGTCIRDVVNSSNTNVSGHCVCDSGWTGNTCSIQSDSSKLELDRLYSSLLAPANAWTYYYTEIPQEKSTSKVSIGVSITSLPFEEHDCDVYVRRNEIPSFIFWDYKDSSMDASFSINFSNPLPGRWYIAFWGYKSCTFNIKIATIEIGCPGNCSLHGTCNVTNCLCNVGYLGQNCENKTGAIHANEIMQGYATQNNWNFYSYIPPDSASSVRIHLHQEQLPQGKYNDCDLYIKRGRYPTRYDFDAIDISFAQSFDVYLPGDSKGTEIFIGVFGWGDCLYSLQVNSSVNCVDCVHGICTRDGICLCNNGWAGSNCNKSATSLVTGARQNSEITSSGEWNYWHFPSSKNYVVVSLKELGPRSSTSGFLYLYIKEGSQPTLENFDYVDIDTSKGFHTITIITNASTANDWVIGVFGSPFVNAPLPYALAAWESPI